MFYKGMIPWNKGKKGLHVAWNKGKKASAESRKRMSIAQRGKKMPQSWIDKMKGRTPWNKGLKGWMPEESMKRAIEKRRGMIPWNKGKPSGRKGIKLSPETLKKMSIARTGVKLSEEHKRKLSIVHKGKHLSEEHKRKIAAAISGEKNCNWIKDRTKVKRYWEERDNPEYKRWRLSVLKRDGYKCRINNCDCHGKVVVHHILPWRDFINLRYDINNGITLCQFHHPRKRADEEKLIPFLKGLVEVR